MAEGGNNRCRLIGDYIIDRQIGSGSFAVVWRSRHRLHGYEVAIKEIATEKLSKKLQESLLSEINILRGIDHPNIIRLHDIVPAPGRIYLVLEYCTGGDLAAYIQRHGRVSEATARHFMNQLAAGLQVLLEKKIIHRDLKPQNLLLSTNTKNAVLKIADFGFARYLQPQGLADTICGSPLYMAPEIMQFQKYDAKADLWSVGAILFQLVTGNPPFSGNSQIQLLQNIMRSKELQFPRDVAGKLHPDCIDLCQNLLRRNSVERLSFEEFFNHKFMAQARSAEGGFVISSPLSEGIPATTVTETAECLQADCLTFKSDVDPCGHVPSSSFSKKPLFSASLSGFPETNVLTRGNLSSKISLVGNEVHTDIPEVDTNPHLTTSSYNIHGSFNIEPSRASVAQSFQADDVDQGHLNTASLKVLDSLEFIEQEYVLVSAHVASTDTLSSSFGTSELDQSGGKLVDYVTKKIQKSPSSPVQIVGAAGASICGIESVGSHSPIPSGTSQISIDSGDMLDRPSVHLSTRLESLRKFGHSITMLAREKLAAEQQLEALSVQLVSLAIWKKALFLSRDWAASSTEAGSHDGLARDKAEADFQATAAAAAACSEMEKEFSCSVAQAEELANHLGPFDGNAEMPDAMEIIFQAALALGRSGAVDELMGNMDDAVASYSKSATLLSFILVEATSLELRPPFMLSTSDRERLRRYINSLTTHQNQSIVQKLPMCSMKDIRFY